MDTFKRFESQLYTVNEQSFTDIALELFRFQASHNPVYQDYIRFLGINPDKIHTLQDIPYLPISFFKNHVLKSADWVEEATFGSSGTTGQRTSSHFVKDLDFYLRHSERCFEYFLGALENYDFLALLPSYLERKDSSLVVMMDHFIKKSSSAASGFYLNNIQNLIEDLDKLKTSKRKTVLWGVSFALLDVAEQYKPDLSHCIVFETGGMKGRRKEITKDELHAKLCNEFNIKSVYSEYGMTELLSQAYSLGGNRFRCPPSMRIIGRDISDPFEKGLLNENSGINVIDLANFHSIAFIETEDLGKVYEDGSFEILGRIDNSDIRGCNLMVE